MQINNSSNDPYASHVDGALCGSLALPVLCHSSIELSVPSATRELRVAVASLPRRIPVAPGFLPTGRVSQAKLPLKGCRSTTGCRSYTTA